MRTGQPTKRAADASPEGGHVSDEATTLALATPADLSALRALLRACSQHLAEQGYRNWVAFDVAASLDRDVVEREVWILRDTTAIRGTWTLGTTPLRDYPAGFWSESATRVLYLNRLAVDPSSQGRGIGARCMRAADARARELGCSTIRLDFLSANPSLRRFYEQLGYVQVGEVERAGWTFAACEKRVESM